MNISTEVASEFVTALYETLLKRSPDREGSAFHTSRVANLGMAKVIEDFLASPEYASSQLTAPNLELNWGPPMKVDAQLPPQTMEQLWQHVEEVWSTYGQNDPYWSVLTDERFRASNLNDSEILREFYSSGVSDLNYLKSILARSGLELDSRMQVAEYGCGVGRLTSHLAREVKKIFAYDISIPHLNAAKEYLNNHNINNIDYIHVESRKDLERLNDIDLFVSIIVLQHNPPPLIIDILKMAFRGLRNGGIAFFQVPVYSLGYEFDIQTYWEDHAKRKTMEMHFVPQSIVFQIAKENNMYPLQVVTDHCIGNYKNWVSNTFLMQKNC